MSIAACAKASLDWSAHLAKARPTLAGEWTAGCYQDRVTLEWNCFLTKSFGTAQIRIFHTQALGYCFSGPVNDFPGATAVVRIGTFPPVNYTTSIACGDTAATLINQLQTEQPGAARGRRWPSGFDEFSFDPSGFSQAYPYLLERIENPRW